MIEKQEGPCCASRSNDNLCGQFAGEGRIDMVTTLRDRVATRGPPAHAVRSPCRVWYGSILYWITGRWAGLARLQFCLGWTQHQPVWASHFLSRRVQWLFFESESSDLVDNQNRIIDDNLSVQLFSACTTFPFLANPCTSNSVSKKNVVLGPLLVSKLRIGMILFLENGIRF
jgi:hypothetical protein